MFRKAFSLVLLSALLAFAFAALAWAAEAENDGEAEERTIDGVPVDDIETFFLRDLTVDYAVNEKLNPDVPAGRTFTLTLGGSNGKPVKKGEDFAFYLVYTDSLLHGEGQTFGKGGLGMPSGEAMPLYPQGYKPDLFLTAKWTSADGVLKADLPAYGPFDALAGAGGKITLNLDKLVYADLGEDNAGEKAKIPAGCYNLFYTSPLDTPTAANGVIRGLNVTDPK